MALISIVTPAYNEAYNLEPLYRDLLAASGKFDCDFEWIIVDDHSGDATFEKAVSLVHADQRVRVIRLARNSGAHNAMFCGLEHAQGDCAAILAADLQDPPQTIPTMLGCWRDGAQVVWAARAKMPQLNVIDRTFAWLYWRIMRKLVGPQIAPAGADMVLLDAAAIEALSNFPERNASIYALITWMGFRQSWITYDKQSRLHGRSGWTVRKKFKLAVDSIVSFTFLPVRFFSGLGILSALLGFSYAAFIVFQWLAYARPAVGWSSLMVAILVIGGLQLLMLGVLGEYMWRSLQEARARPRYLIEAMVGGNKPVGVGSPICETADSGQAQQRVPISG